jgi:nucleoside-diphosphate kinase
MERTLAIFKPDCVQKKLCGAVLAKIEERGFRIVGLKMLHLTTSVAESFYKDHRGKPFYKPLVEFMTEGPCVVSVLEKENAIEDYRQLMGPTDPGKAGNGTIRGAFGTDIQRNIVHGSDSFQSAQREIPFFFSDSEMIGTR